MSPLIWTERVGTSELIYRSGDSRKRRFYQKTLDFEQLKATSETKKILNLL